MNVFQVEPALNVSLVADRRELAPTIGMLTPHAFAAAAANANWVQAPGYYLVLTNQPGAGSWPITGASFILMHANSRDANTGPALKFFAWAYQDGQSMAESLDYVPIPASVVKQVQLTWASSLKVNGQPAWPAK